MARQHVRVLSLVGVICLLSGLWSTLIYRQAKQRQPRPAFSGPRQALIEDAEHGFLSLREARDVCQRRRWEPYATRDRPRKVYDLFLINTELDFLEIRLNELDREVDYFVILESSMLFSWKPVLACIRVFLIADFTS